jgi:hypothetical protein
MNFVRRWWTSPTSVDFPVGARGHVQQLTELGAVPLHEGEEQTAVEWETRLSPMQVLDGIRSRDDAESWVLPDPLLGRVMERLDAYSAGQWDDLAGTQTGYAALRLLPVPRPLSRIR